MTPTIGVLFIVVLLLAILVGFAVSIFGVLLDIRNALHREAYDRSVQKP